MRLESNPVPKINNYYLESGFDNSLPTSVATRMVRYSCPEMLTNKVIDLANDEIGVISP